jgi:iron complex transport system ATP-binding protein
MVLHDLNLAARYADHLVVIRDGRMVACGPPRTVITPEVLREVFGVEAEIVLDRRTGRPLCVPRELSEGQRLATSACLDSPLTPAEDNSD